MLLARRLTELLRLTELQEGWRPRPAQQQVARPPAQPLGQQRQHAAVPEDDVPPEQEQR